VVALTASRSAACCTRSQSEVADLVLIVERIGSEGRILDQLCYRRAASTPSRFVSGGAFRQPFPSDRRGEGSTELQEAAAGFGLPCCSLVWTAGQASPGPILGGLLLTLCGPHLTCGAIIVLGLAGACLYPLLRTSAGGGRRGGSAGASQRNPARAGEAGTGPGARCTGLASAVPPAPAWPRRRGRGPFMAERIWPAMDLEKLER